MQAPADFAVLTKQAIRECNSLRSAVAATVSSSSSAVSDNSANANANVNAVALLHQLDDISKAVCNVIDAAELCRSVHADTAWRDAASDAFCLLSDYIGLLNADTTLYQALQLVEKTSCAAQHSHSHYSSKKSSHLLSEEERRFAVLLQAEFERDGIHLPEHQRDAVRALQNRITGLESSFSYNLVHSRRLFAVHDQNARAVTDVIPASILQQWGYHNNNNVNNNNSTTLTMMQAESESPEEPLLQLGNTDAQILQTLLKYSPDAQLRQQVFMEHMTAVPENLLVLSELVQARHELAVTQGFASYVERNLTDNKMAGSPDAVLQFLQTAATKNRTAYRNDMAVLLAAKQRVEGSRYCAAPPLEPWDIAFYTGIVKAAAQSEGDLQHSVSQYLTVTNTLDAMQVLVERLFGIQMKEEPMTAAEQWDVVVPGQKESSLLKYVFSDAEGRPLGTMYLDLHPREAKYGHAAHFTVRCGCALNYSSNSSDDDNNDNDDESESDNYQFPIVALVCNLSSSTVLSHSEVETLLHEFGHALHSLLSRTKFQHMSGTRAAMDFVETPSHLMENFAWDPEFLKILGRHHQSGMPMPDDMIAQLQRSRYEFAAIERQNQILYSVFDQTLFGVPDPLGPTSTELLARLHREYDVPYAQGTHWHSRFGHLVSYGAGYYGYLYSQVFARDIWKHCFEGNSLDRAAGDRVWHKLLAHGGAKDPRAMLTDLLGRPPQVDFTS